MQLRTEFLAKPSSSGLGQGTKVALEQGNQDTSTARAPIRAV